jgi:hypothetical protein
MDFHRSEKKQEIELLLDHNIHFEAIATEELNRLLSLLIWISINLVKRMRMQCRRNSKKITWLS